MVKDHQEDIKEYRQEATKADRRPSGQRDAADPAEAFAGGTIVGEADCAETVFA